MNKIKSMASMLMPMIGPLFGLAQSAGIGTPNPNANALFFWF